ncbi:MAG: MotA/TolQ/ExbB proton channel family protein [Planctomycetota bacterium]
MILLGTVVISSPAYSQDETNGPASDIPINADQIDALQQTDPQADDAKIEDPTGIDLLTLIGKGGYFMIPIGLMSLLVVTLAVERLVTLRDRNILPSGLLQELERLESEDGSYDVEAAYDACIDNPSPGGRVIGSMLLRTGQPLGEIERTASETAQREANDYAGPIRWLNLAAAATPLMGLLGTVWGMIVSFHNSTMLTPDQSRSEQLSEGIYTALVTTLAALIVAIPAAILAQYLENKLSRVFSRIEELAFRVAPSLMEYTGRARLDFGGTKQRLPSGSVTPPPSNNGSRDAKRGSTSRSEAKPPKSGKRSSSGSSSASSSSGSSSS